MILQFWRLWLTMDMLISAVASDLVSRFISYLVQKYEKQHRTEGDLERLKSVLLRIHTIVEEAEARQIRNRGMILQLKGLMEEQVIDFILHDDQNLAVLPIIGPHRIGKRTLAHHACQDERVRGHFLNIVFFHGDDLRNISLMPSTKYLCIIEFSWDVDVEAWKIFRSSMKKAAVSGSKVIIIGRTDEIAKWGTAPAIRLNRLSPEMYWYYFKALSFGSMNPDDHPKLASLGMQLATELQGSFLGANILGHILRGNPNAEIWSGFLMGLRKMSRKRLSIFEEYPPEKNHPSDTAEVAFMNSRGCLLYDLRETGHFQSNIPRLTPEGVELEGKIPYDLGFDVLVWRSLIPPFCNYIATFLQSKPRHIVRRKKNPLAVSIT
uniref:Disease resistance N-terminal domain-containing protein n=1 Tax=Oryza punctata TaxID=4537 RepID=A0A0E0MCS8_ORYPU